MDIDDGLRQLVARGFTFRDLRDGRDDVVVLIGIRSWPNSCDVLHLYGEDQAIAARMVPSGRHDVDDVVWTYEDAALPTILALLELPAPDEPGAPVLARRAPAGLWLPAS